MVLSSDKDLYIFAGTSGRAFFATLIRFQFSTKKWSFIPRTSLPFISPRYRHEAVTYGDRFYVFGGGMGGVNPSDVCELEEIPSFCFSTKEWEIKKCWPSESGSFPKRRRCHGCVLFQDKVYICGGYDGTEIFDDIWTLDMKSFKWSKFPMVLPHPVYFHSTAVTPSGCMLTFGGIKSLDPERDPRSNDLSCLWLTIPRLLDLSLKAVYSCIPNICSITHDELLKIGIPSRLIPPTHQNNVVPQCG
ncbi:Kelch domain-containing protein 10 [Exaiptasia diaphana]|nr:Kelch domain-containing protein 10 [Exaiptasia diaphana]